MLTLNEAIIDIKEG